jgi:membrane fusion protein (multidrug efflux system)
MVIRLPWKALCLMAGMASSPVWAQATASPTPRPGAPVAGSATSSAALATPSPRPTIERQEIRAQLMPRRYTTIAAEIGAKISAISVQEGSAFQSGQTLVSFDCSLQQAQLQKAQAELDGAEQTFKSNLRLQELNSVGQLELDLSKSATAKAKAELGANNAVLSKCQIDAPFSGRVSEQKAREQQYVQPGQPLLDIIDDSILELEFLVPSVWLRWLKVGNAFQVQIDETRKTYPAKFIRIGARVDPVSQSVKVVAAISGRFPELMAGMSGRVQVAPPASQ